MGDIKRLNYFTHQFLEEKDFKDEQFYHLDMRHKHNKGLHGWGIAFGLEISGAANDTKATIAPGMAIDSEGREIVLETEYDVNLPSDQNAQTDYYLSLVYIEKELQEDEKTHGGVTKSTRTTESLFGSFDSVTNPKLSKTKGAADLTLGKITVSSDGRLVKTDLTERRTTDVIKEIKLSIDNHSSGEWPQIKGLEVSAVGTGLQGIDVNSKKTIFSGDLEIKGNVGIGTIEPQSKLHIQGGDISWGNYSLLRADQGGSIDLGGNRSVPGQGTPYIDFHYLGKTEDYNARIINDVDGRLSIRAPVLHATGKVGIGETAPTENLHINGNLQIDNSSKGILLDGADRPMITRGFDKFSSGTYKGVGRWGFFMQKHTLTLGIPNLSGKSIKFRAFNAASTSKDLMTITHDGNVGIGTQDPKGLLQIVGSGGATGLFVDSMNRVGIRTRDLKRALNVEGDIVIDNSSNSRAILWKMGAALLNGIIVSRGDRMMGIGRNQPLRIEDGAPISSLHIGKTGYVGIRTGAPAYTLHVNGNAAKPGGGSWTSVSDKRLKKDINPIKGALEKLISLRGISYEWKEPEKQGNLTGKQMGLIAQEVEKVFPDWVGTDMDGYKDITIRGFEALTVEAFKELNERSENLKKNNKKLEVRVKALEKKLGAGG